MNKIFIGLLLIFLNFSLTFNNIKINFIPDFIGYIVMLSGLVEMAEESMRFKKAQPFAIGMAIYTGIQFLLDLTGASASISVSGSFGLWALPIPLASAIVYLYITYNIVEGVKDMEAVYNKHLNGDSLKSTWTVLVVFDILTVMMMLIPILFIVGVVATFIVSICFLVSFNHSKNLYYGTTLE